MLNLMKRRWTILCFEKEFAKRNIKIELSRELKSILTLNQFLESPQGNKRKIRIDKRSHTQSLCERREKSELKATWEFAK